MPILLQVHLTLSIVIALSTMFIETMIHIDNQVLLPEFFGKVFAYIVVSNLFLLALGMIHKWLVGPWLFC